MLFRDFISIVCIKQEIWQ